MLTLSFSERQKSIIAAALTTLMKPCYEGVRARLKGSILSTVIVLAPCS